MYIPSIFPTLLPFLIHPLSTLTSPILIFPPPPLLSSLLNTTTPNSPNSNQIDYPIPNTDISLTITLYGPTIPQIYLTAALTSALQKIAPEISSHPSTPIPNNEFYYRDRISSVEVQYEGFIDLHVLSWQQLSWTLGGMVRFIEESKGERARARLDAWVSEVNEGDWAIPYGSLVVRYFGGRSASA